MSVIAEIEKMDTAEKLRTMEALWESLSQKPEDIPVPDWHREELEKTKARMDAGLEKTISAEEAKTLLRKEFS
jgi:hypothetical protein